MTTNLREHQEILLARINRLINALVDNYAAYTKDYQYASPRDITFDILPGTRYYKIVQRDSGTSVHAFISKQSGAVFKPASWKAPAKHARYNLLDDVSFETCIKNADWAGSYLYLR
jgi:hypothetical protein